MVGPEMVFVSDVAAQLIAATVLRAGVAAGGSIKAAANKLREVVANRKKDQSAPELTDHRQGNDYAEDSQTLLEVLSENDVIRQELEQLLGITPLLERIHRSSPAVKEKDILWVDDNPLQNLLERGILRRLGVFVDTAQSSQEALVMLEANHYDLIISDMNRDQLPSEGMNFLSELRQKGFDQRVIFYIYNLVPELGMPPSSFGLTNRPDELIHYVFDALERVGLRSRSPFEV